VLVELRARGFRNLEDLSWQPAPGRQLLLGANGSGKTSLLEAVYLVATTRSFRAAQLGDCARHGGAAFELAAEAGGERRALLTVGWREGRRERAVNGREGTLAEHLAALPVLSWTAAEAHLLDGPPARRRRFLDRGVVGERPAAFAALARYQRALQQKRLLLQRGGAGLEAWNELLAAAAAEVAALRAAYVERLRGALADALALAGHPFPEVALAYRPSPPEAGEGAPAILQRLERLAALERRRAVPLVGSHRDELEIRWAGREVRRSASAGERKALGLALLAGQGRVMRRGGREPLLLLDDADAELDSGAIVRAWRALPEGAQTLAASSRPEAWTELALERRWRLDAGRLTGA
jgi:DNA replication and repair protein RecF